MCGWHDVSPMIKKKQHTTCVQKNISFFSCTRFATSFATIHECRELSIGAVVDVVVGWWWLYIRLHILFLGGTGCRHWHCCNNNIVLCFSAMIIILLLVLPSFLCCFSLAFKQTWFLFVLHVWWFYTRVFLFSRTSGKCCGMLSFFEFLLNRLHLCFI